MVPDYSKSLADVVRTRRTELGLTQDAAAENASVTSRTILAYENEKGNPRLSSLFRVVRALNINANDIFYPEITRGSAAQVKLQTTFADCSDVEAEALYDVCKSVLSSMRKAESREIE